MKNLGNILKSPICQREVKICLHFVKKYLFYFDTSEKNKKRILRFWEIQILKKQMNFSEDGKRKNFELFSF